MNRRLHKHDKRSRGRQALAGQRQAEWQCGRFYTRNFLIKSACQSCGKEKELQKDSYVDEKGLIARWPRQGGGGVASGVATRPAGAAKGSAQVLAQTRLQLTQAREQEHPEEYIRILECKALKEEAEMSHGPEDGPGAREIPWSCRGGREGTRSHAQGPSELRAGAAGGCTDPHGLAQAHARSFIASNASPTSQCEPGQNFSNIWKL